MGRRKDTPKGNKILPKNEAIGTFTAVEPIEGNAYKESIQNGYSSSMNDRSRRKRRIAISYCHINQ